MSMNHSTEFAEELERAMELDSDIISKTAHRTEVDRNFDLGHISELVDMQSLSKVYQQDLKTLQAARTDMMKKAHWIENTIKLLDRRIAINLEALKTLQTPHAMPKSDNKIIDNED